MRFLRLVLVLSYSFLYVISSLIGNHFTEEEIAGYFILIAILPFKRVCVCVFVCVCV